MLDIILSILGLVVIFFLWIMIYDGNRFVVRSYSYVNDKIKKEKKIAMLADLHGKSYGIHNEKLLAEIDHISPDMILIAGDMITARKNKGYDEALRFVSALAKKYPVYYANGNHEYRTKIYRKVYGNQYDEYFAALKEAGVQLLVNASAELADGGIRITGSEIDRYFYKRFHKRNMKPEYLNTILGVSKPECVDILLAHNPDYFEEYAAWGADLVLSGHVHGGMVRLPFVGGVVSPMCRFFPKYDGGEYTIDNSTMILSRGLGMHTIPVRIFNPGEVVVVELKNEK